MKKKFLNVVLVLAAGLCAQSFGFQTLAEENMNAFMAGAGESSSECLLKKAKKDGEEDMSRITSHDAESMCENIAKHLGPESPFAKKSLLTFEQIYNEDLKLYETSNKPDFAMYVCDDENSKSIMKACFIFSPTNIIEKYKLPKNYVFNDFYLKLQNSKGAVKVWPDLYISPPSEQGADLVLATDFVADKSFFSGARGLTVELIGLEGTIASFEIKPKKVKSFDWFDPDICPNIRLSWYNTPRIEKPEGLIFYDSLEKKNKCERCEEAYKKLIKSVKHPSQFPRDYYLNNQAAFFGGVSSKALEFLKASKQLLGQTYETDENFRKRYDAGLKGSDCGGEVAFCDADDKVVFDFAVKIDELNEFKKCSDVGSCLDLVKKLGIYGKSKAKLASKVAAVKMKNRFDKEFKVIIK